MMCNKHELVFIRNLYDSEEINKISPTGKIYKSEWKCSKCGKIKYKEYYNKREK